MKPETPKLRSFVNIGSTLANIRLDNWIFIPAEFCNDKKQVRLGF